MAVKTSGQLSLRYDINTEVNGTSLGTSIRLRLVSATAGFSAPDNMSEFYGYSRNRSYISASGNGALRTSPTRPTTYGNRTAFSMGLWIRNNAPSRRNQNLMAVGDYIYATGTRDYILMRYLGSLNRIIVEVYNNGTRRLKRDYPLHDNPNRTITGITSSSTGWRAAQRGTTDSRGFTHIVCTVDLNTTTATNSIKLYWQGSELTYSVSNVNSGVFPVSNIEGPYASVGEDLHQPAPSGGSWYGDIDNAWIYPGNLGGGVVNAIYNLGNVSPYQYFINNALTPYVVWGFERTNIPIGGSVDYRLSSIGTTSYVNY